MMQESRRGKWARKWSTRTMGSRLKQTVRPSVPQSEGTIDFQLISLLASGNDCLSVPDGDARRVPLPSPVSPFRRRNRARLSLAIACDVPCDLYLITGEREAAAAGSGSKKINNITINIMQQQRISISTGTQSGWSE